MKQSPKTIGEISEAQVLARLLRAGEVVLLPFGDNQRYDLVLDRTDGFVRVQVKTGRLRDGVVRVQTSSSGSTTDHKTRMSYVGQVDCFAAYCPENDTTYLLPIGECTGNDTWLRIEPPRNGQKLGVRLAEDYEYPHGRVAQSVRARP